MFLVPCEGKQSSFLPPTSSTFPTSKQLPLSQNTWVEESSGPSRAGCALATLHMFTLTEIFQDVFRHILQEIITKLQEYICVKRCFSCFHPLREVKREPLHLMLLKLLLVEKMESSAAHIFKQPGGHPLRAQDLAPPNLPSYISGPFLLSHLDRLLSILPLLPLTSGQMKGPSNSEDFAFGETLRKGPKKKNTAEQHVGMSHSQTQLKENK